MSAELGDRLRQLDREVGNVLVAAHALQHSLRSDHPPFSASLAVGLKRYGPGPVFNLWSACRAAWRLRAVWTGLDPPAADNDEPAQQLNGGTANDGSSSASERTAAGGG